MSDFFFSQTTMTRLTMGMIMWPQECGHHQGTDSEQRQQIGPMLLMSLNWHLKSFSLTCQIKESVKGSSLRESSMVVIRIEWHMSLYNPDINSWCAHLSKLHCQLLSFNGQFLFCWGRRGKIFLILEKRETNVLRCFGLHSYYCPKHRRLERVDN